MGSDPYRPQVRVKPPDCEGVLVSLWVRTCTVLYGCLCGYLYGFLRVVL